MDFRTWKDYRRLREVASGTNYMGKNKPLALPNEVKNPEGGYEPRNDREMEQYKHADLITLPEGVEGTNCGNCRFLIRDGEKTLCDHHDLKGLPVTSRQCCLYWDHQDVKRSWGGGQAGHEDEHEKSED